jgi:hypothetical protein
MEIMNFYLGHLSNDRYYQFGEEFRDRVYDFGAAELKIEPQFNTWLGCFGLVDIALKKISKSTFTEDIMEADGRRNRAFRGMDDIVGASLNHFKPEVKDAARKLQIVLDAYGNVPHKPLSEKTGVINNLIQELKRENYAEYIKTLGITDWMTELYLANAEVYRLTKLRENEAVEKPDTSMREARTQVDAAYKAIIRRINSLLEVEGNGPDELYSSFAKVMNVIIEGYNRKN